MNGHSTRTPSEVQVERARARATVYHGLSELLLPPDPVTAHRARCGELRRELAAASPHLPVPLDALLAELARREGSDADLAGEHMACFGPSVGTLHPPYSAEYGVGSQVRKEHDLADIAGIYRAFGVELAEGVGERHDHFGVEADFLAFLALKEAFALLEGTPAQVEIVRQAKTRFARRYLEEPVRVFAERLGPEGLYARTAAALASLVAHEASQPSGNPDRG